VLGSAGRVAHPVRLIVSGDLRRSRLTTLFRIVLAVPHLLWLTLWGFALVPFAAFQWLWAVCAAHVEPDAHAWLSRYVRYRAQVTAYVLLLAGLYPPFHGRARAYAIDVAFDPPARQRRAAVVFRLVLAVPALVFDSVLEVALLALAVVAWFAALALGRIPDGVRELGAYFLRYDTQTLAYVLLLTPAYPSLSSEASDVNDRSASR
jgi:hypothetical protein